MHREPLPKDYAESVCRVYALQAGGSQEIAHLIVACYWLYSYLVHVGPDKAITHSAARVLAERLQTLEKILGRMIQVRPDQAPAAPDKRYTKPYPPSQPAGFVPGAPAGEGVGAAIAEIGAAESPLSVEDSAKIATILFQTGRFDLAERVLSDVKLELAPIPSPHGLGTPALHVYALAQAWAYLGRADKAREIGAKILETDRDPWNEAWLANIIAIGQFYRTGDLGCLMSRFVQLPGEIESPKNRLGQFMLLLQVLLDAGAEPEIERALSLVRETLLDPGWDFKYRLRLTSFLELLWPYRSDYSVLLYRFVSQLLIAEAKRKMTFRAEPGEGIVTIDCLTWFVRHWAGVDKIEQARQMSRDWREALVHER